EEFAPAESRVTAERARLAMDPRAPGESREARASRQIARMSSPGSTLQSATPVTATPGTSAAWGQERVTGSKPGERRSRAVPVAFGAGVVGLSAVAALAFALHAPAGGTAGTAAAPAAASELAAPAAATAVARTYASAVDPGEGAAPVAADAGPGPAAS